MELNAVLTDAARQRVEQELKRKSFPLHPTFHNLASTERSAILLLDAISKRSFLHRFDAGGLFFHTWYNDAVWRAIVLVAAVAMLMVLPFFEAPCSDFGLRVPTNIRTCPSEKVAALVEGLVLLPIIWADCMLRLGSQGFKLFRVEPRNMAMLIGLIIGSVDLVFASTLPLDWWLHPRILRLARPVYLACMSEFTCVAVVEMMRTIVTSLQVASFLVLFVVVWAALGLAIFGPGLYFTSYYDAFMSMFTLLTTANYPDVMLPAYRTTPWASLFFISFLALAFYTGLPFLLATVASTYRNNLQKRALHAYRKFRAALLVCFVNMDTNHDAGLQLEEFQEVYLRVRRLWHHDHWLRKTPFDEAAAKASAMRIFTEVNKGSSGVVGLDEFYNAGDLILDDLTGGRKPRSSILNVESRPLAQICVWLAQSWLCWLLGIVVGLSSTGSMVLFLEKLVAEQLPFGGRLSFFWDLDWVLLVLWATVVLLCRIGMANFSFRRSVRSGMDEVLLIFIAAAFVGKIGAHILMAKHPGNVPLHASIMAAGQGPLFRFFLALRGSALLIFFAAAPQPRGGIEAFVTVLQDLGRLLVCLLIMFQVFGTIGMSIFGGVFSADNVNLVGSDYANTSDGYYDFANFNSWREGSQALFYLMVVNNWYVMARAAALALNHNAAVIFFILYYLICVAMVLNLVLATFIELYRLSVEQLEKECEDSAPRHHVQSALELMLFGDGGAGTTDSTASSFSSEDAQELLSRGDCQQAAELSSVYNHEPRAEPLGPGCAGANI